MSVHVPRLDIDMAVPVSMLTERASDLQDVMGSMLKPTIDYSMDGYYATVGVLIRMAIEQYNGEEISVTATSKNKPADWDAEHRWVEWTSVTIYDAEGE